MSDELELCRIADAFEKLLEHNPKYLDHNLQKVISQLERLNSTLLKVQGSLWAIANPELKSPPDMEKLKQ